MKIKVKWILGFAILLAPVLIIGVVKADQEESKFQWVIASVASAKANDDSKILLTGNGTFVPTDPDEVSGGGTWQTFAPDGTTLTGSGSYTVKGLVRFDLAPGAVSNPAIHAGLTFLRLAYSDGSRGILVVSCHLPGTPDSVFEGATASKGFVEYWNRIPSGTFFRVVTETED